MPWPLPWKRRSNPQKRPPHIQSFLEEQQRRRIERIAHELYQNRLLLNRPGDAQSDWETATRIVKSSWHTTLFANHRPLIQLEKKVWEPLLAWANNQALLGLLGLVGNVGLIIAVITYIGSEKQRRDAEVLNAWQTLTSAHGQAGNGGRKRALEFLNASPGANWRRKFPWFCAPHPICVWPRESLSGVDFSVDSQDITKTEVQNSVSAESGDKATTGQENVFTEESQATKDPGRVYLVEIQLSKADLSSANLRGVDLQGANLQDAFLINANLQGTFLGRSNLQDARLDNANLQDATLGHANLQGALLRRVNLQGVYLGRATLQDANLARANLQGAIFLATDLYWAKNLTQMQLEGDNPPLICNSPLPPEIKIKGGKNRDCDQMANGLLEGFPDSFESFEDAEAFVKRKQQEKPGIRNR